MKNQTYFEVEYRLISGFGVNRGEIGGLTCIKDFQFIEQALEFINKYELYKRGDKVLDTKVYHLVKPKIWHMFLRGTLRKFERFKQMGEELKYSDWAHNEGDIYVVKVEFFNLKTRLMDYMNLEYKTLKEVFDNLKFKDSKTRLLSDWTFYSKSFRDFELGGLKKDSETLDAG